MENSYDIITPTCRHLDRFTKDCLTEFLEAPVQEYPQVFYMWGHGYEFDYGTKRGNDAYLESLFYMVSRAEDVLCVTNRELVEILAYQRGWRAVCYPSIWRGWIFVNPALCRLSLLENVLYNIPIIRNRR